MNIEFCSIICFPCCDVCMSEGAYNIIIYPCVCVCVRTHTHTHLSIYEWRKVVCFILKLWDPPNQDASYRVLGVFGKLLMRRGCVSLVPWCLNLRCKSSWILNDFCPWKFKINSKKPVFWKEKSVEDVVTLGPTAQATLLNIEWFLPVKIQNKFQKNQVLEGKISWGRGNTWANSTGHTRIYYNMFVIYDLHVLYVIYICAADGGLHWHP
jgi:hypothetical protein